MPNEHPIIKAIRDSGILFLGPGTLSGSANVTFNPHRLLSSKLPDAIIEPFLPAVSVLDRMDACSELAPSSVTEFDAMYATNGEIW